MYPVAYKAAVKKMHHYNAHRELKKTASMPATKGSSSQSNANEEVAICSMDTGEELEFPTLPRTNFKCQKGIGEWIDKAETFSSTSKAKFQQWTK